MSKMNKKLPALFLTLVLVLGMTACGGKATDGTTGSTDNTVTAEEEDHKTQNTKVDPNSPITEEMLRNHAVAPAEDFTYDVEDDGIISEAIRAAIPLLSSLKRLRASRLRVSMITFLPTITLCVRC